jgi:predicted ATPase/DNA-binding SARP family transcriptional activator
MDAACRIELLGGFRVEQAGRSITRFRTYKTGALLAYLAFHRDRPQPREVLIDLLWPDGDAESGRNNLSKSLGSLRNQLEPPGVPAGAVILADRASIRLNPITCTTDVADFQAAIRVGLSPESRPEKSAGALARAIALYGGELLPGIYEDWNLTARAHLSEAYLDALQRLIVLRERVGDLRGAREYARRAVAADPLREEPYQALIHLSLADGDTPAALRQYREWERLSTNELGTAPSSGLRAVVAPWLETAPKEKRVKSAPRILKTPMVPATPALTLLPGTVTLLLGQFDDPKWGETLDAVVRRQGGLLIQDADPLVFTAAFARATEAAACAVAIQHTVGDVAPPIIALQTGEVSDAADLRPLQREGARLLAAAHAGQILCAEAAAALLRRDPEPGVRIVDLGLYHLPGGGPAERLFDVQYPRRPESIPAAPNAEAASRNTLPLQMTRFFGREQELALLREAIETARTGRDNRLWTLTGPGGMGKTRLSLEVARASLASFADTVWFVPLAEIRDPDLLIGAVLETLGLRSSPSLDSLSQAAQALSERPSLLVLDNFEQLSGPTMPGMEAVQIVTRLLEEAPSLICVITSRHRLGIIGEREFPLAPLSIPAGTAPPEVLADIDSVRLFVDRAQAVRPDFQITSQNAAAVADLCERLEGLPLAIELAAARAQVLTPAQMLKQLERRFDFLVGRQRNFAERHRTIRATIDWSYALLTPELRRFAGQLSVFRGGWTLEAAEAVTGEPLALDYLEQLVECSLVLAETGGAQGEMRYRQLETLRQYAQETLPSEEKSALVACHGDYFLGLAGQAEPHLQGPEQAEWLTRLETDHDNLRAALDGCAKPERVESGLRGATALWRFWHVRGHVVEGRERLAGLLRIASTGNIDPDVLGNAQIAAGILARFGNDVEAAQELLMAGVVPARARGDSHSAALALYHLGLVEAAYNRWETARSVLTESLDLGRAGNDRAGVAAALSSLAIVASELGEFPTAQRLFTESLSLRRALGDKQGIATQLFNLGNVALLQTDYGSAQTLFEESLALRRELGDRWGVASLLNSLGLQLSNQGEYPRARDFLEESLALFREVRDRIGIAVALGNLGTVALMTGDPQAREILMDSLVRRWEMDDRTGVAFVLESLLRLEVSSGDAERAVTLWAVVEDLREATQSPRPPNAVASVEQAITDARRALSEDAFTAACAHGRRLELAQALALVLDDGVTPTGK